MNRAIQSDWNPNKGVFLINEEEAKAFLVTTSAMSGGAPNPLQIVKKYGKIDIETGVKQIYFLTKVDAASTWDVRLPITIKYADAVCKQRKYLPRGRVVNCLPFI